MQAPVEVSTYDEVKAILTFGEYHICCKYHQIFHSSKEIVNLTTKDRSYTLNDLKDLESKIILIRDSKPSTVNDRKNESQLSEDMQKAGHNILFEKLSTKEVDEFLDVRI